MRKMYLMAVWMILILIPCALLMPSLEPVHRVALLVAASAVCDLYIVCRARVERAKAPLILRDESVEEKTKPPKCRKE